MIEINNAKPYSQPNTILKMSDFAVKKSGKLKLTLLIMRQIDLMSPNRAFLAAQLVKNLPEMQETRA